MNFKRASPDSCVQTVKFLSFKVGDEPLRALSLQKSAPNHKRVQSFTSLTSPWSALSRNNRLKEGSHCFSHHIHSEPVHTVFFWFTINQCLEGKKLFSAVLNRAPNMLFKIK